MHFSPRSGEEIFMHFFYAFRAKREKIFMHFFKHLCCFPQTLKKTLTWSLTRCFWMSGADDDDVFVAPLGAIV